jgi:sulfite reductase alpha subunit-like flavoprotein
VKCAENERVTANDHFQDTRLVSFDSSAYPDILAYKPGDVLMVQPRNLQTSIDLALTALGYSDDELDKKFYLRPINSSIARPPIWLVSGKFIHLYIFIQRLSEPTTLRQCFSDYFDLQMIPRRSFFATLALYSNNDQEKGRLRELADMKNLDEYLDYCQRPRRTVAEAFRDFYNTTRHLHPEVLFNVLTPIRARAFSIASSPSAHPERIQLLIAKVSISIGFIASSFR